MTGVAVPPGELSLERRAQRIARLFAGLPEIGAVRQRVCDLLAHVVAAHATALERIIALAARPDVVEADGVIAEVLWVHRPGVDSADTIDRYGNRIDALLTAIEQSASPDVAEVASTMAGEVVDLYGEALERIFELLHDSGQGDTIRAALDDDLVGSLLVVHGLHPKDLEARVVDCLADLAATLPEHGGLVELVGIDDDGLVSVELHGGSEIHRWRTRLAVERAIDRAAPDHGGIRVLGAESEPVVSAPLTAFIPLDQVRRRAANRTPRRWVELPTLADLADGAVRRVASDGVALVACNVGGDLYVTADPFEVGSTAIDGLRVVERRPPAIAASDGRRVVFDTPLPVQRTGDTVEVMVP